MIYVSIPSGADASQIIQQAIDNAQQYETIVIPSGFHAIKETIWLTGNKRLIGENKESTILEHQIPTSRPSADSAEKAMPIVRIGAREKAGEVIEVAYNNELANIGFSSASASTNNCTAIEIVDCSNLKIRDCNIKSGINGASYFSGTGIIIRGRECISIRDMMIYANKPIEVQKNPNKQNPIDADHFCFNNLYLGAFLNPVIEIMEDVHLMHMTFDGFQAWVGGTHGFKWVDANENSRPYASLNLRLDNVKWEQANLQQNPTFIQIELNKPALQNLVIQNIYGGLNTKGLSFRKVSNISINDSQILSGLNNPNIVALDTEARGSSYSLLMKNVILHGSKVISQYNNINQVGMYSGEYIGV
ncbi:MAG TPA: hypothetical protein PK006_13315 [Saprospiraceae bacterium]|nr:hypothetical protein [Saprospiraceae bacterium]